MTSPVLETERLILRPLGVQDFSGLCRLWAEPEAVRYQSGLPEVPELVWSRLLASIGHWQAMGFGNWALTCRAGGAFLGMAGFFLSPRHLSGGGGMRPEASWMLLPEAQGKGMASEAAVRFHQWSDQVMDWAGTSCLIDPQNSASVRIASKLEYRFESRVTYWQKEMHRYVREA